MRKTLTILCLLCLAVTRAAAETNDDAWVSVTVPSGGQLQALVEANGGASIKKLKVSGILNYEDLGLFRSETLSNLQHLNIENVTIITDDDHYYYGGELVDYYYSDRDTVITGWTAPSLLGSKRWYKYYTKNLDGLLSGTNIESVIMPRGLHTAGNSTFSNCKNLKQVVFPDGLKRIDGFSFGYCSALESINLNQVVEIGASAFYNCTSLTSVSYSNSLLRVSTNSFSGTPFMSSLPTHDDGFVYMGTIALAYDKSSGKITNTTTSISFRAGTTSIADNIEIPNTTNITSVSIPSSLLRIGNSVFRGFGKLTSIALPNDLKEIGDKAFYSTKLSEFIIPTYLVSIGDGAFSGCNDLTTLRGHALGKVGELSIGESAFGSCQNLNTVVLPVGTVSIGASCFSNCSELTAISLPSTVSYIGRNAFSGCTKLGGSLSLPSISCINEGTFNRCSSLKGVVLSEKLKSIASEAFHGCERLESINLPSGLTTIDRWAFRGCSSITSLVIPNGVTSIGNYAFAECTSLTDINIPTGLTAIPDAIFSGCSSLKDVIIPEGVQSIGRSAFSYCRSMTSITIPRTLYYIDSNAFDECSGLTSVHVSSMQHWLSIEFNNSSRSNPLYYAHHLFINNEEVKELSIPSYIKELKNYVFSGCVFESIDIPEGVSTIGRWAFYESNNLKSVTIPNSVTDIQQNAFYNCVNLKTVKSYIKEPFEISSNFIYYDNEYKYNDAILYVPKGTKAKYEALSTWNKLSEIKEFDSDAEQQPQGDVNGDGEVNVTDLVPMVNMILGITEHNAAADVNGDGEVNVTDLVPLVNLILKVNY